MSTDQQDPSLRRKTGRAGHKTSAARLAAVQALYEIDLTDADTEQVINDFIEKRWRSVTLRDPDIEPGDGGKARLPNPDPGVLRTLIDGVITSRDEVDQTISEALEGDWTLERLDALMRNLLRTAAYELKHLPDTPRKTVLSEYGDLAHTFFDEKDAKFAVAAILNLAQLIRPES
jgi:transcription antitermination protein NusB